MQTLRPKDILALGFMIFALYVGAGNIIFPPMIGLQAGEHLALASAGFLLTAVGLPVLTIIAIARAGGDMASLTKPLGKIPGTLLIIICYLAVGPFFATPRTATVSFEIGIAPLTGHSSLPLFLYSLAYFTIVIAFALYPDRLLDNIGRFLAPLKMSGLAILGIAAYLYPAGPIGDTTGPYITAPFTQGILDGYLTMDALAGLIFGIVITSAIRSRGVSNIHSMSRYTVIAGFIAATGLVLVYLSLFHLGVNSHTLTPNATNGAEILYAYVHRTFGNAGNIFLTALILLACIVTAIGLTIACAEYFATLLPLSYKVLVFLFAGVSFLFANLGLTKLILISVPVLTAIYPPCITLVLLSLCNPFWRNNPLVMRVVMGAAFVLGSQDALRAAGWHEAPSFMASLPLYKEGLAWMLPCLAIFLVVSMLARYRKQTPSQ